MQLVTELCRALTTSRDLAGLLTSAVDAVARRLDTTVVQIWIPNGEETALELRASTGRSSASGDCSNPVPLESFGIGRIARDRRSYFTNAVADDPYLSLQAGASPDDLVAFAGYPLLVEDRLLGVLSLYFCRLLPDDFISETACCADVIALGIDHKLASSSMRQHEAQLRQSQKLETLGRSRKS